MHLNLFLTGGDSTTCFSSELSGSSTDEMQICVWGLCVINHYQVIYGTGSGQSMVSKSP